MKKLSLILLVLILVMSCESDTDSKTDSKADMEQLNLADKHLDITVTVPKGQLLKTV